MVEGLFSNTLLAHVLLGVLSHLFLFHHVFSHHVLVHLHPLDTCQPFGVGRAGGMFVEGDVVDLVLREDHLLDRVQGLLQNVVALFRHYLLQGLRVPVVQTDPHLAALDHVGYR